ncbi:MAG: complex I subunit 4 family protein, partial [Flavobacterium sp.]
MDVSFILIILLFGAAATYFVGDKWASKAALIFSTAALAATIYVTYRYYVGETVNFMYPWIKSPKITLFFIGDRISLTMVLLTTALTPIIVASSFGNLFPKTRAFYALIM